MEFIDGAVGVLLETPCAGEVDDANAGGEPLGRPLAGVLVGQREEDDFGAGVADELPVEGEDFGARLGGAEGELRVELLERDAAGGGVVGDTAEEERLGFGEARVVEQQAGEFAAGVAAYSGDGGAHGGAAGGDGGRGRGCRSRCGRARLPLGFRGYGCFEFCGRRLAGRYIARRLFGRLYFFGCFVG